MSTRIFNLTKNSPPVPGPNFFWARDEKGLCTGRHTFTAVKGSMEMPPNQARFAKGTPVTTLDPSIGAILSFLTVESFEVNTLPGGYEEISASFKGYTESGEFGNEDDRNITYGSDTTLVEQSCLENPNFIALPPLERFALAQCYNGLARGIQPAFGEGGVLNSISIVDNISDDFVLENMTNVDACWWYQHMFTRGTRTWLVPTFEWQKSTANAGGLSNSELENIGRRDNFPPGNPPRPPGSLEDEYTWLKMRCSDVRSRNAAETGEHWQWGVWPEKVYNYGISP